MSYNSKFNEKMKNEQNQGISFDDILHLECLFPNLEKECALKFNIVLDDKNKVFILYICDSNNTILDSINLDDLKGQQNANFKNESSSTRVERSPNAIFEAIRRRVDTIQNRFRTIRNEIGAIQNEIGRSQEIQAGDRNEAREIRNEIGAIQNEIGRSQEVSSGCQEFQTGSGILYNRLGERRYHLEHEHYVRLNDLKNKEELIRECIEAYNKTSQIHKKDDDSEDEDDCRLNLMV